MSLTSNLLERSNSKTVLSSLIESQGFAIIPDVFTRSELAELLCNLTEIALHRTRAGIRNMVGHAPIAQFARDYRLLKITRLVLGAEPIVFRATLFDKSQRSDWLVAWHQDRVLPLREKRDIPGWGPWSMKGGVICAGAPATALSRVIALRVHLDDSTTDNGPLRVLPGSHVRGVLKDDELRELAAQVAPVDCLVPQGGVVVMRPLVVHASSKAQSRVPRRVLHFEYATSTLIADGIELAVG